MNTQVGGKQRVEENLGADVNILSADHSTRLFVCSLWVLPRKKENEREKREEGRGRAHEEDHGTRVLWSSIEARGKHFAEILL